MNSGPSSFVVSQSPANGSPHCGKPARLAPSVMEVSRGVKRRVAISRKQVLEPRAPFAFPFRCNPLRTGLGSASLSKGGSHGSGTGSSLQSPENGSRLCKLGLTAKRLLRWLVVSQSPENGSRLCKLFSFLFGAGGIPRWSQSPENGSRLCK